MNMDRTLDAALQRSLKAPHLSAAFRGRLRAEIARNRVIDTTAERGRLERELEQELNELRSGYLILQRRTLALMLGGAFTAGVAAMFALPWLQSRFGSGSAIAVPLVGAVIGLAIGAAQLVGRAGPLRP